MARMTQYIGLTGAASLFVQKLNKVEDSSNYTTGMFEEIVPLGTWKDHEGRLWREVVQDSPWSSGPMIFTALAKSESPNPLVAEEHLSYPWIKVPGMKSEFNATTGEYWV